MRRRYFIALMGAAAVGGCTGSEEDIEDPDNGEAADDEDDGSNNDEAGEEDENEEPEEEEENEEEAVGEPSIEFVDHELVVEEGDISTDVYVAATVENVGDAPSGTVELVADWYDAEGNYLDNDSAYLQTLGAGETWAARIYFLGSEAEEVDDYEVDGEFNLEPQNFDPDGLDIVESEMKVGDSEVVVEGRVENNTGEVASYIQSIAKIYDAEGVVLGDDWTNVSDVPDGEVWTFDVSWRGRDRIDQADDHKVLITDSAF